MRVRFPFARFPVVPTSGAPPEPNYLTSSFSGQPPGIPRDQAIKWYWRVKTWQLDFGFAGVTIAPADGGLEVVFPPFGATAYFGHFPSPLYEPEFDTNLLAYGEAGLCAQGAFSLGQCSGRGVWPPAATVQCEYYGSIAPSGVAQLGFHMCDSLVQGMYYDGSLYYPNFTVTADVGCTLSGVQLAFGVLLPGDNGFPTPSFVTNPDGISLYNANGTIYGTIDGASFQLRGWLYAVGAATQPPDIPLNMTITPYEYWTYTGDDGIALFDDVTGEQLDPTINVALASYP